MVTEEIDILMITETKLDDSFPASQLFIQGFCTPFRLDRNKNGGEILLYIISNITSTKLNRYIIKNQIEAFFVEIRIRNSIWLLCCSYNPSKLQIASHIQEISNGIDAYCKKYENILITGDFNVDVKEVSLHLFCNQYKLKSLNKDPTCYKNIDNPSCIDLFLTNSAKSFESTCTIEAGLSDFHKLVVTVLNEKHERMPPKVIQYINYRKFDYAIFNNNLRKQTKNLNISELDFATIRKIFMEILDKFAPSKKKYIRANHSKFVTKKLSKAIMLRSKLRNQFLKTRTQESKLKYNKQRNLCVSITRKAKRSYYENLDLKDITDSKKFWAKVKPLFSNKIKSTEYITLEENGKIISNDKELARIFNEFFCKQSS